MFNVRNPVNQVLFVMQAFVAAFLQVSLYWKIGGQRLRLKPEYWLEDRGLVQNYIGLCFLNCLDQVTILSFS